MKTILDLDFEEAREYFLKQENYVTFDLPIYFSFQKLLVRIDRYLTRNTLSDLFQKNASRGFENTNYRLLTNKDGRYAWRPYQLIHPVIYVSLVHEITKEKNWKDIQKRFASFAKIAKIECQSLPIVEDSKDKSYTNSPAFSWWQSVEQRSISLSLDYQYVIQTDITDCYGSIYTHSISWALHEKSEAKKKENRNNKSLIGNIIDNHLQDMNYGQTNGIPQGSTLMDFIAEMVLGYVDKLLSEKLSHLKIKDYKIIRYRDDYRIFTNNSYEADQIAKTLSETLSDMGLKLNVDKTFSSDNVIKSSIKADKRYWIANKRKTENKQKWLIQIHLLSEQFPNSGTLEVQMREFLEVLKKSKRRDSDVEVLISITTDIACRNPRVCPIAISILSLLLGKIRRKAQKQEMIKRIQYRFLKIPNSSFLKVWLQRLSMKADSDMIYDEIICKKVIDSSIQLWNIEWLSEPLKKIMVETPIIKSDEISKMKPIVSNREIKQFAKKKSYYPEDCI